MKSKFQILAFFLTLSALLRVNAQENLVPNPSFESAENCDWEVFGSEKKGAKGWDSFRGSTDYMNKCNQWSWANFMGAQTASSGTGYAGFYATFGKSYPNEREILGTKLITPLVKGFRYNISIKFSMAERYPDTGCNNIGVLFLTKGYNSDTYTSLPCKTCMNYLPNYAHAFSKEVIKDYTGWTEVSGEFIADSAYTHIAIGNFFTDDRTVAEKVLINRGGKGYAYYYVDEVSVYKETCKSGDCNVVLELPNIFTPNDDGHNDAFIPAKISGVGVMHTLIYNRWGERIFESNDVGINWKGKTKSGEQVPTGMYYWLIECTNEYGDREVKKGWVNLIR